MSKSQSLSSSEIFLCFGIIIQDLFFCFLYLSLILGNISINYEFLFVYFIGGFTSFYFYLDLYSTLTSLYFDCDQILLSAIKLSFEDVQYFFIICALYALQRGVYILFQSSEFLNIKFCLLTFKLLSNSLNKIQSFLPFCLSCITTGSSYIFLANPLILREQFQTKVGLTSVLYLLFQILIFFFYLILLSSYLMNFSAIKLLNIYTNLLIILLAIFVLH